MKNEIGLKLIAMELGVSITTVSRALRDCSDISEAMKAKVREKAVELKYTPNILARSLVTGKSNFICVVMDSIKSPYFSMIIDELSKEFKEKSLNVCLLPTTNRFLERNNVKEAVSIGAAAIITFLVPNKDAVEYAILLNKPLLVFGRSTPEKLVNKIYTDDIKGGSLAAEKLVSLGHSKLMYIGSALHEVNVIRQKGFVETAKKLGVNDIVISSESEEEILNNIKKGYKGIFCFDDQLAMRVLSLTDKGEVDLVGFNGLFKCFGFDYYFSFPSVFPDYMKMINKTVDVISSQIHQDGNYDYVDEKYDVKLL